jgi:hypothetical protein
VALVASVARLIIEAMCGKRHGDTVPPEPRFAKDGGESLVLLIVEHCSAIFADFRPIGRAIEERLERCVENAVTNLSTLLYADAPNLGRLGTLSENRQQTFVL